MADLTHTFLFSRALSNPAAVNRFFLPPHFTLRPFRTPTRLPNWFGTLLSWTRRRVSSRMHYDSTNPLIVQGDRTILLEVDNPKYADARDALAPFAELEKSPEHIHTYRLTSLSLWNAAAAGMTAAAMIEILTRFSKFPLPTNLASDLAELVSRYGRVKIERGGEKLRLVCDDPPLLEELARQPKVRDYLGDRVDATSFAVEPAHRGVLKQGLIAVGYPAEDLAGYTEGASLPTNLRKLARSGLPFVVRDYQRDAAEIFYAGGDVRGGSGVIVLPCGAGRRSRRDRRCPRARRGQQESIRPACHSARIRLET